MALNEQEKREVARTAARFDPWSGNRLGGVRWFAASTAMHLGLLVLFATVSMTVVKTVEKIRVKVVQEELVGIDEYVGEPSLEDVAGLLDVQPAPRREAALPNAPVVQHVSAPKIPKLGVVGPKLGRGPKINAARTQLSFGSGAIAGLGGQFGDYVGGLRKVGLDIALVIDTTSSMQFVIDEVKDRLAEMAAALQRMVPATRIGIVAYRDHGEENDYVVRWTDLSFRTDKLRSFLDQLEARGGGDWEEAVLDGLDAAMHDLSWRKRSKKIVILVGGSPPHPEDVDAVADMVRRFRDDGGYVSAIDVTEPLHRGYDLFMWRSLKGSRPYEPSPMPEHYKQVAAVFGELAEAGGGDLVQLAEQKRLMREVLVLTFGRRFRTEMAQYLDELT